MAQARLHAIVQGRVQGVGFRVFVRAEAERLKLGGFVRNLRGNQVEVVAEGELPSLECLLRSLQTGPPAAHVTNVQASWAESTCSLSTFSVRSSG